MSVTNQNQENDDSLKVIENKDGTFSIEWNPCDSRWSVLNDLSSEEISAMIMEHIESYLKEYEDQDLGSNE